MVVHVKDEVIKIMKVREGTHTLVIHCANTPNGSRRYNVTDVKKWHVHERGWSDIGYHAVIETDGTIKKGRSWAVWGAHVSGHNTGSFGLCLMGKDEYTLEQWASLKALVKELNLPHVKGHKDFPGVTKTCPGFEVDEWLAGGMEPLEGHIYVKDA